jgi:hypothetical protein
MNGSISPSIGQLTALTSLCVTTSRQCNPRTAQQPTPCHPIQNVPKHWIDRKYSTINTKLDTSHKFVRHRVFSIPRVGLTTFGSQNIAIEPIGWTTTRQCCSIDETQSLVRYDGHGLATASHPPLIRRDLSSNQLTGALIESIGQFKQLEIMCELFDSVDCLSTSRSRSSHTNFVGPCNTIN